MKYRREKSIRTSIRRTNKMEEQTEMTFWDHLEALRWMILRCLIALAVFLAAGFFFMPYLFEHVVMAPCRDDFFLYRAIAGLASHTSVVPEFLNKPFHVEVINIKLSSQLFMHFTLSFWLAFLCTFPYLVYEVWKFICPALYSNEKRGVRAAFLFGTVMFFIGCAVGSFLIFMVRPKQAILFIIVFLVLQQIEGNLIYPHVVGESVGLPSIWVLAAVTIGGNLMGIVGMLVFIPLLSVLYTIFREFVYLRLKKKHIKQVTKTEIEEYTVEETRQTHE